MTSPEDSSAPEQPAPQGVVRIRTMKLEDLEAVHAIDCASFSVPWPKNSYRYELLQNPASLQWVAEIDFLGVTETGEAIRQTPIVAGMIVVWLIEDEAHIATIAVDPAFRNQGIGRLLVKVALVESMKRGANAATLEVRAGNKLAQELYRSFGFVIAGRRPHYYKDNNEDALIMTVEGLGPVYANWLENVEEKSIRISSGRMVC